MAGRSSAAVICELDPPLLSRVTVSLEADPADIQALLGAGSRDAFDRGHAALLIAALERPVVSCLVSERASAYVTVLYGMLLLRRDHELEPLHDDLERFVAAAARALDSGWDDSAFARDLDQLEVWGAVERRAEPLRIRGYKDIRRERFRYRLTDDAIALLEWLESRLQARVEGRSVDSRDLLIDVLGAVKELGRVVRHWHSGERSDELPRRALHLASTIEERVHAIGEELIGFRAAMVTFASRPYDLHALRAILAWLERYVGVYVERIETLRKEIGAKLDDLAAPRLRHALGELYDLASRERLETPAAFRATSVLRNPGETLDAARAFFADRGRLVTLCARIDESARAVLRKMHRHLRELERRSARVDDLRARTADLAALDRDADDPRLADFANAVVGSAHARFAIRRAPEGGRLLPPLPRQHTPPERDSGRRPLKAKRLPPDAARQLRARRLFELRRWLEQDVLAGRAEVRISEVFGSTDGGREGVVRDSPRRWLDVSRARHLDRGRDLEKLAVEISTVPGTALLKSGSSALVAPDCLVAAKTPSAVRRRRS